MTDGDGLRAKSPTVRETHKWRSFARIGLAVVLLAVLIFSVIGFDDESFVSALGDQERLRLLIADLGALAPIAVVFLMALAIVVSPLPSAPIALAAGAAFGHLWGTVYVVVGAELGAFVAFFLARFLGHDVLRRWFGDRLNFGFFGSQNALTGIVFASRLLPFLSFDLVSYAAGLTPLKMWRFLIATLAGIVPMSFLLAHFGGELASVDARRMVLAALALGLITFLPVAIRLIWGKLNRQKSRNANKLRKPS